MVTPWKLLSQWLNRGCIQIPWDSNPFIIIMESLCESACGLVSVLKSQAFIFHGVLHVQHGIMLSQELVDGWGPLWTLLYTYSLGHEHSFQTARCVWILIKVLYMEPIPYLPIEHLASLSFHCLSQLVLQPLSLLLKFLLLYAHVPECAVFLISASNLVSPCWCWSSWFSRLVLPYYRTIAVTNLGQGYWRSFAQEGYL